MSFGPPSSASRTTPREYDDDDFSFQPKLNARSVAMEQARVDRGEVTGRDRGEYLHNKDYEIKYKQEIARKRIMEQEMEGCTFSPQINPGGGNRNHVSVVKNSQLWNERKEEWRHQATEQQIRREMQECTFQPNIQLSQRSHYFGTDGAAEDSQPEYATGFEEFVERQKLGREKRAQEQARKDAPAPRAEGWTRSTTKPVPFKFEHPVRVRSLERPAKAAEVTAKEKQQDRPPSRGWSQPEYSQPDFQYMESELKPRHQRVEQFLSKYNPEAVEQLRVERQFQQEMSASGVPEDFNSEQAAEERYYKRMEEARRKQAQKREALKNLSGGTAPRDDWTTTQTGQWKGRQTKVQEFQWNRGSTQPVASLRKPVQGMRMEW